MNSLIPLGPCFSPLNRFNIISSWSPFVKRLYVIVCTHSTSFASTYTMSIQDTHPSLLASSISCMANPSAVPPICTVTAWHMSALWYVLRFAVQSLTFYHHGLNVIRFSSHEPGPGIREGRSGMFAMQGSAASRSGAKDFNVLDLLF